MGWRASMCAEVLHLRVEAHTHMLRQEERLNAKRNRKRLKADADDNVAAAFLLRAH